MLPFFYDVPSRRTAKGKTFRNRLKRAKNKIFVRLCREAWAKAERDVARRLLVSP